MTELHAVPAVPFWWTTPKSARSDTWVVLDRDQTADITTDSVALAERLRDSSDHDDEPIDLYVTNKGRWQADMLFAQGDMIIPVSPRFVATLEQAGATGWKSVPAVVHAKDGSVDQSGFRVLVVTGRCGDSERDRGTDDIDPAYEWDGSDLFWVASRGPSFAFFVTDRIKQALENAGLQRVEFEAEG